MRQHRLRPCCRKVLSINTGTLLMKMKTFVTLAVLAFFIPAFPAHAVSKEIIQLQTQVQELQDAIAHLQTTNDERMGVCSI